MLPAGMQSPSINYTLSSTSYGKSLQSLECPQSSTIIAIPLCYSTHAPCHMIYMRDRLCRWKLNRFHGRETAPFLIHLALRVRIGTKGPIFFRDGKDWVPTTTLKP